MSITWKNRNDKSSGSKSATERGGRSSGEIHHDLVQNANHVIFLTLAGIQVTEVKGREFTFGAGYRIPNFQVPIWIV